jgi:hypothetical protein
MTTKQENTITMWQLIIDFLTLNQSIWLTTLTFKNIVDRFLAKRILAATYVTTQTIQTKGATTDKANALIVAIDEGVRISSIIQAYATDINDNTLFTDMNFPKSNLNKLADTDKVIKLRFIHSTATTLLLPLTPYEINQITLDDYKIFINNYDALLTRPRQRRVSIKEATTNLSSIITAGNKDLKTLDKISSIFKISHPEFYAQYFLSREIIDLGSTTTKIKIIVTDSVTNAFIPEALITNNLINLQFITDEKGVASGKMPFNTYNFTINATDYIRQTINAQKVKLGQTFTLKITLVKA